MAKKTILKINGMHCASCAMNIDDDLEDTKGVKSARTNYATQKTEVEFEEVEINIEEIVKVIRKTGYHAQTKTDR